MLRSTRLRWLVTTGLLSLALALIPGAQPTAAAPPASGTTTEDAPRQPRHPDRRVGPSVKTTWTTVSGCLEEGSPWIPPQVSEGECEGITIEAHDHAVVMRHQRAMLNCCADISVDVRHTGEFAISFVERESGDLCFCLCPYDLQAGAGGLAEGLYLVDVRDPQGTVLCERRVQIGPRAIGAVASGCQGPDTADGDPEEESIEITVVGDSIVINHRDAFLNCCLELEIEVYAQPGYYRVTEHDRGLPCDCLCTFDFVIVIPGVPPGEHLVELVGVTGETLATVTVSVPQGNSTGPPL